MKSTHVLAWLLLIALVFVTLAPIQLRPDTGTSAQLERFAAFALVGAVFVVAYPRRLLLVAVLVLGSAIGLEVLQFMAQTRHPGMADVVAKVAGGCTGLAVGRFLLFGWRRFRAADRP